MRSFSDWSERKYKYEKTELLNSINCMLVEVMVYDENKYLDIASYIVI
jgi:hypothetical protein